MVWLCAMLEYYSPRAGAWTEFYVVDVNTDEICERELGDLPDKVAGKYMGGLVGYTPVWYYITVEKSKLRQT